MNLANKITLTSKRKKPLIPECGFYPNAFEAKQGLLRLISDDNRTRSDIIDVIVASSKIALPREAGDLAYQAMLLLNGATPDEAVVLGKAIQTLPPPLLTSAQKIALSDTTGMLSAAIIMSGKTPQGVYAVIDTIWSFVPRPNPQNINKRTRLLNDIIWLSDQGVPCENTFLSNKIANIIQVEGWHSDFTQTVITGFEIFPSPLDTIMLENAPTGLASIILKKTIKKTHDAHQLINLISLINDDQSALEATIRFMTSEDIPVAEKITLYKHIVENLQSEINLNGVSFPINQNWLSIGCKLFASIPNQETFNIALEHFLDGSDIISVKELTGNLNYSLPEFPEIMKALSQYNAVNKADPKFLKLIQTLQYQPSSAELSNASFLFDDNNDDQLFATFNLHLMKTGASSKERYMAMLSAAIMIAVGIPMSIALLKNRTTAQELADNPEIVSKGVALAKSSSPEIKQKVEEIVNQAYAANHSIPPAPQKTNSKPTPCEITKAVVDAVITLEYNPRKMFSEKGAGGRMQLMPATWESINQKHFQGKYPFAKFVSHPWINKKFGTLYLQEIKAYLDARQDQWKTDQLPLIFACYFGGINNVRKANFDPVKIKKLYPKTYEYMVKGSNLTGHDTSKL